jgi:hypothetical protein
MTSIAQKLQLKPNQPLAMVNPPAGYQDFLTGELPANPPTVLEGTQPVNALLLFVNNLEEARNLMPIAIQHIDPDCLLWLAYPKGSSKIKTDANRDRLWEALTFTGWRPVRQIALDDTWSAIRYRPADRVGKT